jgi:type IV pilus assembly protein PilV
MIALRQTSRIQAGFSMIEVLVALVILMVGLLGLAGLMAQGQRAETESYQRVQALILAKDMVGRINANRAVAANQPTCYGYTNAATGAPYVGTGGASAPVCTVTSASVTNAQITQANKDMADWSNLLQGATETSSAGNAGAMVGARGCVSYNGAPYSNPGNPGGELLDINGLALKGTGVYTVEVAWQGTADTYAPASLNCGKNLYGTEGKRRDLSLTFRIGSVNNTQKAHPYP